MTLYERWISPGTTLDAMYGKRYFAQTFTVGNTGADVDHHITSVKLLMRRVGLPEIFTVDIRAVDGAGLPTGANLASGTYDGDTLPLSTEYIEINLTPYLLIANTKYAIVVGAPDAVSGIGIVEWRRGTGAGYGGGSWCYSTDWGVTWGTNLSRDYTFEEHGYFTKIVIETGKMEDRSKLTGIQRNEKGKTKLRGKQ